MQAIARRVPSININQWMLPSNLLKYFNGKQMKCYSTKSGSVNVITSHDQYKNFINGQDKKKAVVYFTAAWCGPCRMIGPVYESLSKEYKDIGFAKVDVDELDETAASAGIRSMPTFHVYKNGIVQESMNFSGADAKRLKSTMATLDQM